MSMDNPRASSDSTDAARWRIFCKATGWTGGAHDAAQKYNEMAAQLAQYGVRVQDPQDYAIDEVTRWRTPRGGGK